MCNNSKKIFVAIVILLPLLSYLVFFTDYDLYFFQSSFGTSSEEEGEPEFFAELEFYRKVPVCSYLPLTEKRVLPNVGHVCVIVRSYSGHINATEFPLGTFLNCMEAMEYDDWSMYVIVPDVTPAPGIELVLKSRSKRFRSRYHFYETNIHRPWECTNDCGYAATDWAIYHACPNNSRWLLVTQGDNEYSPTFLSHLNTTYDAVGFDWFSRYASAGTINPGRVVTPTKPCDELIVGRCMVNIWIPGRNDLGTVVWNYERFTRENKGYGKFAPSCCHDGAMAAEALNGGWKLLNIPDCLYSHNPNPWSQCRHRAPQK